MKRYGIGVLVLLFATTHVVAETGEQFFLQTPTTWQELGYKGKVKDVTTFTVQYWNRMEHNIPTTKLKTPECSRTASAQFYPFGQIKVRTYYSGAKADSQTYTYDVQGHLTHSQYDTYVWKNGLLMSDDMNMPPPANMHRVFRYDKHHNLVEADDFTNNETKPSARWLLSYDTRGDWIRIDEYESGKLDMVWNRTYDVHHHLIEDSRHYEHHGKMLLMYKDIYTYSGGVRSQDSYQLWDDAYTALDGPEHHYLTGFSKTTYNRRGQISRSDVYQNLGVTKATPQTLTKNQLSFTNTFEYGPDDRLERQTIDGVTYAMSYDKHGNMIQQVEYQPLGPGGSEEVASITDYAIKYFDGKHSAGTLNDTNVRIRLKPTLKGFILPRLLQKGERVRILDETPTTMTIGNMDAPWYEVETKDGLIGWAYGAFIDKPE